MREAYGSYLTCCVAVCSRGETPCRRRYRRLAWIPTDHFGVNKSDQAAQGAWGPVLLSEPLGVEPLQEAGLVAVALAESLDPRLSLRSAARPFGQVAQIHE